MSARRPWAWPLVPAYRAGAGLESALYRAGMLPRRKLQWPVISVGSLSAGGAGKTPVVIALATLLRERGWKLDVLSRGHGREGSKPARVDTGGSSRTFGDEPMVIAERTGVPVWVGADRHATGTLAEDDARKQSSGLRRAWRDKEARAALAAEEKLTPFENKTLRVHLLDDGFQHRRMERDFDIVLLTAEDVDDVLLPAGNLREPLTALRRADAVVLREEEREDLEAKVRAMLPNSTPLWSVRRSLRFPSPLGVFSAGLRPVAFCGLARPEGFAAMLQEAGCGIVETVAFRDHHAYTVADADHVVKVARGLGATGLVTTEKDAVKLTPEIRSRLEEIGPLMVVALDAEFVYNAPVIRALEAKLHTHAEAGAGVASNAGEARLL